MPVNTSGSARTDVTGASIIAGAVVVSTIATYLRKVLVASANGSTAIQITDGVGGAVIGVVAASAVAGTIYALDIPVKTSINIPQTANAGNLAIVWD